MLGRALLLALVPVLLAGCVTTQSNPARQACLNNMEKIAEGLKPAFARLGYRPTIVMSIDDDLANYRGTPSPPSVYADSSPGGRIRLRPLLCSDSTLATVVVAHEMSHVALGEWGEPDAGITLAWEAPRRELRADALARKVLKEAGAPQSVVDFLGCRLGQCETVPSGWKHKPVGTRGAWMDPLPDIVP